MNKRQSRLQFFAMLFALVLAAYAVGSRAQASGPTGPTPPPYSVAATVTPLFALPGTQRNIVVAGLWPTACVPGSITVLADYDKYTRTPVLRLNLPLTLAPCAAAVTPYTLSTIYTPEIEGYLRVIVVSSDGVYRGETNVVTDLPNAPRARFDINGNWYDPITNGSGLSFAHSHTGSDSVFGTWYLYDSQGLPRWYSIQGGRWVSNTQYVATLYETRAPVVACPPSTVNVCPMRVTSVQSVGTLYFTVHGKDSATAEARNTAGISLFTSSVIKMGL